MLVANKLLFYGKESVAQKRISNHINLKKKIILVINYLLIKITFELSSR